MQVQENKDISYKYSWHISEVITDVIKARIDLVIFLLV